MTHSGSPRANASSLRVSYLFPQFPVPTEVFAVSDILALRALGHEVLVHTVKPRRRDEAERLRICGVPNDLPISRPSLSRALRWPGLLWRMRSGAAYLLIHVIRRGMTAPATALTALLCIPRVLEIAEEVREVGADVVHVFWSRHAGMVLPILARQESRALRSAFVGAYDLVAGDFLVDMALEHANAAFSHAEANRAYLETKVPATMPVTIVRRGIPLIPPDASILRDPCLWITASSLTPAKNVEGVLHTFALACRSRPELRLAIFGEGPDRSRLEQCSHDLGCSAAVRFGGHVQREELFRHMQQAAVFLLLSKKPSERLPNVVKEALWAGCAIISSNSEGIEELLPDRETGLVIDPDDASAVAEAVRRVLGESPEEADRRRLRARRLIAKSFSDLQGMREYIAAWRAAMESCPSSPARAADLDQIRDFGNAGERFQSPDDAFARGNLASNP